MRSPRWEVFLKNHEHRLKPPYPTSCFGEPIGALDSGEECWEVKGDLREQYYTAIHPKLYERLFAIFGTASISDWITLPVYMVGQHRTNALPTVMVCSEDENACKKAKKEIKKSGLLKQHARFKVMCVTEDPGIRNMEQLASDANNGKAAPAATRAMNVLVDRSKPLQPLGMEVWVDHGSSLRPTTAFMSQIKGRTFLRTVDHAFVTTASPAKPATTTRRVAVHVYSDSDSDSDSDSESDDEDELDVAITSIGSKSPDTWSDSGSHSGSSSAPTISSGRSTPSINHSTHVNSTVSSDLQEVSSRLVSLASLPTTYPLKQIAQPSKDTLISLGRLAFWSVDKDWALIEIANEDLKPAFEWSIAEHTLSPKPLPGLKDDAEVVAYTSSGGMLTGTFSGTPFCTRLPNSTSFQDVYRVRLNDALANGDCGSAVRNAATGELYGHIVAGCRATGTAYIMAAHQIEADFEALVMEGLPGPNRILNEVHVLTAEHADAKEENKDAVVDRHQSTSTECQPRRPVRDLVTPVPLPNEDEIVRKYDKIISNPFLTQEKEIPHPTKRGPIETSDGRQHCRFSGTTILYWSELLFGWLLSLLYAGCKGFSLLAIEFGVLASDPKPKSWSSSLICYGLLLAPTIPHPISIRIGRVLNAAFAIVKFSVLVVICVIGYLAHAGTEPKHSSFISKATAWILPFMALLVQLLTASASVLLMVPGLGFLYSGFAGRGLSSKIWLVIFAPLVIIFQVQFWGYNLSKMEQFWGYHLFKMDSFWKELPTQSYGLLLMWVTMGVIITGVISEVSDEMTSLFPRPSHSLISYKGLLILGLAFLQGLRDDFGTKSSSSCTVPLLVIASGIWYWLRYWEMPNEDPSTYSSEPHFYKQGARCRLTLPLGRWPIYPASPSIFPQDIATLHNEGKGPTSWKAEWRDLHVDERSYDWDVGFSLRSLLFGVTVALFSMTGFESVRILTAGSPPDLDSGHHSASDTTSQVIAGLIGTLVMIGIGLAWTRIATYEPRIRYAILSSIVLWLQTNHHRIALGIWLFMSGADFLHNDTNHGTIPNAVIIPMMLSLVFFWFIAAQGRMRRLLERSHYPLRGALVMPLVGNILVLLGYIRYGNSGLTLLFNQLFPPDLHEILGWRLQILKVFVPIVLVALLVYLIPESPGWMIKHGEHKQALHAFNRARGEEIVACRSLAYLHSKIELEKRAGRLESEPLPKHFQENPRIMARVECLGIWCSFIAQVLCALLLFSATISGKITSIIQRLLWIEIILAYSGPVIFIALFWIWKCLYQLYALVKDFENFRNMQEYGILLSDSVPEEEARLKLFVQPMLRAKAHLRVILCVSVVILMGLNSFLLKEVENWKRMSFGLAIGDIVAAVSLCKKIYESFCQDISTLKRRLEELKQLTERLERQPFHITIHEAETLFSNARGRKISQPGQGNMLDEVERTLDELRRRIAERDPDNPRQELEGGEEKKLDLGVLAPHPSAYTDQSWTDPGCPQIFTIEIPNDFDILDILFPHGKPPPICWPKSFRETGNGSCHDDSEPERLEHGYQKGRTLPHPTVRKALLCPALAFVMGINAFLLKEVENWKRELYDDPCDMQRYSISRRGRPVLNIVKDMTPLLDRLRDHLEASKENPASLKKLFQFEKLKESMNGNLIQRAIGGLRSDGDCSLNTNSLTNGDKLVPLLAAITHSDHMTDFVRFDHILPICKNVPLTSGPGTAETYEISISREFAALESKHDARDSAPQLAIKVYQDGQRGARRSYLQELRAFESLRNRSDTDNYQAPEHDQRLAYDSKLEHWMRLDDQVDHLLSHSDRHWSYGTRIRNLLHRGRTLSSQYPSFLQSLRSKNLPTIHDPGSSLPEGYSQNLTATTWLEHLTTLANTLEDLYTALRPICNATRTKCIAEYPPFIPTFVWQGVDTASQRLEVAIMKADLRMSLVYHLSLPISDSPFMRDIRARLDAAMSGMRVGYPSTRDGLNAAMGGTRTRPLSTDESNEANLEVDDNEASATTLALIRRIWGMSFPIAGIATTTVEFDRYLTFAGIMRCMCQWVFQLKNTRKGQWDWRDRFDRHRYMGSDQSKAAYGALGTLLFLNRTSRFLSFPCYLISLLFFLFLMFFSALPMIGMEL